MEAIQKELTKALFTLSFGKLSAEQAEKKAIEVTKNFDINNEALSHKGLNWYAKQILKNI